MSAYLRCLRNNKILANYFHSLDQLQRAIFLPFIKRDYVARHDQYDAVLHQARLSVLKTMQKIRRSMSGRQQGEAVISKLAHLYEIIFSLNCLRQRVNDHELLEVFEQEFKVICANISFLFKAICKKQYVDLQPLSLAIDSFSELYHGTLRVVAPDPLVFLFFMQGLIALQNEVACLSSELPQLI